MRSLLIAIIAISVLAAGCGGSKAREKGSVRVRGPGDAVQPAGTTPPVPGAPFSRTYGDITGFDTNNVKALVSATMNPETDMQTPIKGISLNGDIRLNTASQDIRALGSSSAAIVGGSEFVVYIIDNLTGPSTNPPPSNQPAITIGFKQGQNGYQVSGTINGGHAEITFTDQYGDIYLSGNYNTNSFTGDFTGTISFKNSVGASAGQRITLGNFRVSTCGFFHCQ